MPSLQTNVFCIKGKSTFNTRRSNHNDLCIYHKKFNKKNIDLVDLIDWYENDYICKTAKNHVKALIEFLSE